MERRQAAADEAAQAKAEGMVPAPHIEDTAPRRIGMSQLPLLMLPLNYACGLLPKLIGV